MACVHSVDYKYQPIFDIQTLFHEFSDKNKGTLWHLVFDDYRNAAHQLNTTMEFRTLTLHTLMYAYSKSMTVRTDRDTVDSVLGKTNCVSIFIMIKWKAAFCTRDSVCHTDLNSLTTQLALQHLISINVHRIISRMELLDSNWRCEAPTIYWHMI